MGRQGAGEGTQGERGTERDDGEGDGSGRGGARERGGIGEGERGGEERHFPIPKKGNVKECSNYHTSALISQTSKAMLKILQGKLQQYMNRELPDVQAGFRKDSESESHSVVSNSLSSGFCWLQMLCGF